MIFLTFNFLKQFISEQQFWNEKLWIIMLIMHLSKLTGNSAIELSISFESLLLELSEPTNHNTYHKIAENFALDRTFVWLRLIKVKFMGFS
jgi:hypothetical protein